MVAYGSRRVVLPASEHVCWDAVESVSREIPSVRASTDSFWPGQPSLLFHCYTGTKLLLGCRQFGWYTGTLELAKGIKRSESAPTAVGRLELVEAVHTQATRPSATRVRGASKRITRSGRITD
jgi:hypothetical protein